MSNVQTDWECWEAAKVIQYRAVERSPLRAPSEIPVPSLHAD